MQNLSNVLNYHLQRYNFVSKYHIRKKILSQNDRYENWTSLYFVATQKSGRSYFSHHTTFTLSLTARSSGVMSRLLTVLALASSVLCMARASE